MRIFRTLFLAVIGTTAISTSAQSIYKCGSTFSDQPCGPDAKQIGKAPTAALRLPADIPPSADRIAANLATCDRTTRASMKDPDAAKIRPIGRVGPAFQWKMGERVVGVNYAIAVNGKNSYGGYTGEKTYFCGFDSTETTMFFSELQTHLNQ